MTVLDVAVQGWMRRAPVIRLFTALEPQNVRFVGGCVRNALMGVAVNDIDLATCLRPDEVQVALRAARIEYVPTGLAYGTLMAVLDGDSFEITSLRRDMATDGRHARVKYTRNWRLDALRRDFTFNALYADFDGRVEDPTGQGLRDLQAGRVRFIGTAAARIEEDYLRILRYFRFLAWYGRHNFINPSDLAVCKAAKAGVQRLSGERIGVEMKKLLAAPDPVQALAWMDEAEVLAQILPAHESVDRLAEWSRLEHQNGLTIDPLLRLMMLLPRQGHVMADVSRRLKLSRKERQRLQNWAKVGGVPDQPPDKSCQYIYQIGQVCAQDLAYVSAAQTQDTHKQAMWLDLAQKAQNLRMPVFPLSGGDLKLLGLSEGPQMGRALMMLECMWVDSDFMLDKTELLAAFRCEVQYKV